MMKRSFRFLRVAAIILLLPLIASSKGASVSGVSNAAPGFSGGAAQGKNISLQSLRGRPVLLLITPSADDRSFRRQLTELRGRFERLAAKGMIGFVAFTGTPGVIRSNIPFLTVNDPAAVSASYDVSGFAVAVIGVDGNLDCLSAKPLPGQRILDLVNNNASVQEKLRR